VPLPNIKLLPPLVICTALALSPAIAASGPRAQFLQRPSSPVSGEVTTFDASRSSCDREPCSYRWSIASTLQRLRHARAVASGRVFRYRFRGAGARYVRLTVANERWRRSTLTKTLAVSRAASALRSAAISLEPVDGGVGYYGRFSHPLPSNADYFPIGAWFRPAEAAQIPRYTDFGMNLFVGVEYPEGANEAAIRQAGMRTLIYIGERTRFNDLGGEVAGWLIDDEADMQQGPGGDTVNCTGGGYDTMRQANASTPSDGRARYANYGKGVGWWETDAQASCFVNEFQDLQSIDAYWMTDPNEKPPAKQAGTQRAYKPWSYGWSVDRMRALDARDGERKPIWNFVETGWPWGETEAQGGRRILPAEARAAVWHSIIAGARGIIYFDHHFNGPCDESVIRAQCYHDTHAALKATNHQIKGLAPVLNSPSVRSGWTANAPIRAMVKWHGGHFYVFAGSRKNAASTGTWSLPCVGDATAVRLGESGSVRVTGGSFDDHFADGNAIHIYRIDGGSTCGLAPGAGGPGAGMPQGGGRASIGRLPRRVSLRSGRLKIRVTCTVACTVRSRLTIRVGSRRFVLAAAQRRFTAGRHRLVLRLTRRDRRRAAGRVMRIRTVITEPVGRVQRTQRLVARRY
jgi:hypothetical protein